jgi:flagellar biogenesis protein FliO
VAQLVEDDGHEEQQGRRRGQRERLVVVACAENVLVAGREQPDVQEQDEEPARVDSDPDSEQPYEMDGAAPADACMLKALSCG